MRRASLFICLAVLAQDDTRPTPQQKAAELLKSSSELATTASPAIQVSALIELARLYQDSDRPKALEMLEQALSTAGAVPPDSGAKPGELQSRVARTTAQIDVDKASEMLPAIPVQYRVQAVEQIVQTLIAKEKFDRAVEVLDLNTGQGAYPFRSADTLLRKLPPDDPRRVSIFGAATTALDPSHENITYIRLLARHWPSLPRPTVDAALAKLVSGILDQKAESTTTTSLSTAKGSVDFDDNKDYQLFDLFHLLEQADPEKAAELKEKRPQLAAAVARFPQGTLSMNQPGVDNLSTSRRSSGKGDSPNPAGDARMKLDALASALAQQAASLAATDVTAAVNKAREIPSPHQKTQTLARIAKTAAEKEPTQAASVLTEALASIKDIKDPQARVSQWAAIAEAAIALKDDTRARDAIDKGLSDCAEIYKLDVDAENPNTAPREYWPSTQYFRTLLHHAAKTFSTDADTLLTRINDPDLQLMGRIQIARSLLGKSHDGSQIWVNRANRR